MKTGLRFLAACAVLFGAFTSAQAAGKPNILIIWGDDIGWNNPSCYHRGMMGYQTPNIDRIAKEGALFTDWYGQQTCTAGRAAFITGQSPFRTACSRSACPGPRKGISDQGPDDRRVAQESRLHDRAVRQEPPGRPRRDAADQSRFDEFFGNLYHLNAEQEPEHPGLSKNPEFKKQVRPARRDQVAPPAARSRTPAR